MKWIGYESLADITSITAGTGLSGGGTAGDITLNVDASIPEITTLAGLTSFGSAGATTNILAGDLTMYNDVADGDPTISIGSSATERFIITAQTSGVSKEMLDVTFDTATGSSVTSAGRYFFKVDGTQTFAIDDFGPYVTGSNQRMMLKDTTTSSVHTGGKLTLQADDGAAMGNTHVLGRIEFGGAEDSSNTITTGAKIIASADAAWSSTENGGRLTFYTTDADATEGIALSLTSDQTAIFQGKIEGVSAEIINRNASSSSTGGSLILSCNDEATMGSGHRLGVIEFQGAEDGSSSMQIGSRIESITDDTWAAESTNAASLKFYTTAGAATQSLVLTLGSDKKAIFTEDVEAKGPVRIIDTTTSSSSQGGILNLRSDDGAALGDDHRLGKIGFQAAEDGSSTIREGARIAAYADAAWSASENGTRLEFSTMDGNNSSELSLTLDSDKLATFAGDVSCQNFKLIGNIEQYREANDANLTYKIGKDANDNGTIQAFYHSGAQTLSTMFMYSYSTSSAANAGMWSFWVDEVNICDIDDGGIDLKANKGISIGAADILTDSSGTATLSNIDALDATTEATIESAIDTLGNLTSASSLVTVGTIGTGVWEGTAVATDQQKHVMHYRFMGYGQGDGTNYFLAAQFTDAQSPWEHNDASSSDGLTITAGSGTNISELMRSGGHVMVRAATLKKWTGWGTYNGSDNAFVSIYKWTPVDDDSTDITPVLLDTATIDGEGNDKARSFAETSFTQASVAAGDIIFTQVKTETNNKTIYFNSTLEVEF